MINPVLRSLDVRWKFPGIGEVASRDILLFIILNEADIILTTVALGLGSSEVNLIFAYLESPALMALAKVVFCILIIAMLLLCRHCHLLKYLNIGLCLVVIWNIVAVISWS